MSWLQRLRIDKFLVVLICVVALASFFPCRGIARVIFENLTTAAIALLFFMHGAKLSREAILGGISHWKLHVVVFLSTFAVFPLLGLAMKVFVPSLLSSNVYMGFLYLCALPATVQSAIAFTSVAGGHDTLHAIGAIILQLMVPFVIGHLSRPLIGGWVARHKKLVNMTDRSSILLVVYVAFSAAVVEGIWQQITGWTLVAILAFSLVLLALVLIANTYAARWLGFDTPDEITIVFCGSKKSLANGIPMANVLFPAAMVGTLVLPLMIFHQVQLMVCAVLAQRYAREQAAVAAATPEAGNPH